MPQPTVENPQNCVARALYDNIAESPDELAFRRGDLLTVLEQNTGGIEGWWLCSLRGRQGICPGNRLRLLAGVFDTGGGSLSETAGEEYEEEVAALQRLGKRRSWHVQPNKVVTPQRVGDVYLYDLPPGGQQPQAAWGMQQAPISNCGESYDVPRSMAPPPSLPSQCYDAPRSSPVPDCSSYDVPRPHFPPAAAPAASAQYDTPLPSASTRLTPSSSASSLTAATTESSSNRSSGLQDAQYDIPPPPVKAMTAASEINAATLLYDVPPTVTKEVSNPVALPLEQSAALETLSRLEAELQAATTRLLGFVLPDWRMREALEPRILDLKLAAHRVRTALHDLLRFCEGALGNAINAADRGLAPKLRLLLRMLRNSESVLGESTNVLDRNDWSVATLARTDEISQECPDALDQLITIAKEIPDNTRQACSFIQGNAPLLFKREMMESSSPPSGLEDYDYVNLESKVSVSRSHSETKALLAPQLREHYDSLISGEMEVLSLDPSDQRVLGFFAAQAASHAANLTAAIDAFLLTIEQNQPPAAFLAHGKFVVLSAHKLVSIGDSVHRHVSASAVRERVLQASNSLSDALAGAVHKTKKAALQFPSVSAVQEMVDSVVDISHLARDLKLHISHAAHTA
ncbi:hypothetical protein B566_EDAN004730 [Ephemera danica]|nr:hypothetical protein B566_EDAN004730 [Ephemera danica]